MDGDKQTAPNTVAESFRSTLDDFIVILRRLAPHCNTPQEMIEMAELALRNDAQLALLMREIAPLHMKR